MKQVIASIAVGVGLLVVAVRPASAQLGYYAPQYGQGYRPQLSPYLPLAGAQLSGTNFNPAFQAFAVSGFQNEMNRRYNYAQARLALSDIERQLERGGAPTSDDEALLRPLGAPGGAQFGSSGHLTANNNTIGYFGTGYPRLGGQGTTTSSPIRQPPRTGTPPR
jgi:hypothetical protein